jgi:hypothetical protein
LGKVDSGFFPSAATAFADNFPEGWRMSPVLMLMGLVTIHISDVENEECRPGQANGPAVPGVGPPPSARVYPDSIDR